MNLIFLLYDLVFFLGWILYLPFYARRKKINLSALREKFALYTAQGLKDAIWIQVVSVGEVNVITRFIHRLREVFDYPVVITTTTLTGNSLAKKKYSQYATILFFPFDFSWVIRRFLKNIKPKIFIAVETEIWPNLFYRLSAKHTPIVIINGRISNKAYARYKKIKPAIKWVLNKCSYIGAQNDYYKQRFLSLGCPQHKIKITGNMKFESIAVNKEQLVKYKQKFSGKLKNQNGLLILAGSTHHPEEEAILGIYKNLKEAGKNISLLIAPRHIDRVSAIEKQVAALGFIAVRMSNFEHIPKNEKNIFLLDTIGELIYFYSLSDICFVGGSLSDYGGHNILEPIYFLKPTIFGPHMDNFRDIEEIILTKGAAFKVKDSIGLCEVLERLIDDEALRGNLRLKCLDVFDEERKGLEENLKIILQCMQR
jgi:3-deoxy-D-manno-octulosonic-acid transferase